MMMIGQISVYLFVVYINGAHTIAPATSLFNCLVSALLSNKIKKVQDSRTHVYDKLLVCFSAVV